MPQTTLRVGRRLLRVGCQFHVYPPFGKICGNWKVVYIFCGFIFQVKKKKKDHEHKFQKKKESGEGN